MSFEKDLADFAKQVEKAGERVFRGAILNIFSSLIKRTPVGNPAIWLYKHPTRGYIDYLSYKEAPAGYVGGRLRNNWQVGINRPSKGTLRAPDKTGRAARSRGNSVIKRIKLNQIVYLMNNLPYAEEIEEGSSSQAPAGMVRVTISEWKATVNNIARKNAQQSKFGRTL